ELIEVPAHAVAVSGLVERGQHAEELVGRDLEAARLPVAGIEDVGVRAAAEGDDAGRVSGGDEIGLAATRPHGGSGRLGLNGVVTLLLDLSRHRSFSPSVLSGARCAKKCGRLAGAGPGCGVAPCPVLR